jgi:symplekin
VHRISQPDSAKVFQDLTAIKLNILQRMDSAPISVRICCVKYIQKVVQVETPGTIADPRVRHAPNTCVIVAKVYQRPDSNETSIALVPRAHPLLVLPNLEAEAFGLLDRLLSVFQDDSVDPIIIDATLNCLAVLIRTRPAIANKILSAILNFNPLKHATHTMTPRLTVIFKSMERTTRALFRFIMRAMPNHPLEQKIQAYLLRLHQARTTFFSDSSSLKRPAEPTDGLDPAKRQRLVPTQRRYPPLPPPPNTIAQLFTLTEDPAIQQFDVKYLPVQLIDFTIPLLLKSVPQDQLDDASNAIRARFSHLSKASRPTPVPDVALAGPTGIDDDDEYDPDFDVGGDQAPPSTTSEKALEELMQPTLDLGPFELPKPPPMSSTEVAIVSEQSIDHVFGVVHASDITPAASRQKLGMNRLAASANDRDAWVTILLRLVTRTPAAIDEYDRENDPSEKKEEEPTNAIMKQDPDGDAEEPTVANRIRHRLFMYILEDFRTRLNVAISWLNEEWYTDKMAAKARGDERTPNYSRWCGRLLDRLLPYLDARDKNHFIRLLSEIPAIDRDVLDKVAMQLARDPERVSLFVLSMQYLLMMRPPVRKDVLDVLENVWREGDSQVQIMAGKVLQKWRPGALEAATAAKKEEEGRAEVGVEN